MKKLMILLILMICFIELPMVTYAIPTGSVSKNVTSSVQCLYTPDSCNDVFAKLGDFYDGYLKFIKPTIPKNAVVTTAYLYFTDLNYFSSSCAFNVTEKTKVYYCSNQSWVYDDLPSCNSGTNFEDSQWLLGCDYVYTAVFNVSNKTAYEYTLGTENISFRVYKTLFNTTTYMDVGDETSVYRPYLVINYEIPTNYTDLDVNHISYSRCINDTLLSVTYDSFNSVWYNYSSTEFCSNDCDDITNSCRPDKFIIDIIAYGIIITIIIISILLLRRIK